MTEEIDGWAIVQNAPGEPRNKSEPIILALVDRLKTQELWWSADDLNLVMKFHKKHAADHSAARLKGARVVTYEQAVEYITAQHKKFSGVGQ